MNNNKTIRYRKPYPKTYIAAATAFGILLCGIWTLYGVMYTKDSQISRHCRMSTYANSISNSDNTSEAVTSEFLKLKAFIEDNSVQLSAAEQKSYNDLSNYAEQTEASNGATIYTVREVAEEFAEVCNTEADTMMESSKKMHIAGDYAMMGIFFSVIAAILVIGQLVRKKEEELMKKSEQIEYQEERVERANNKTKDIAYTNLIMRCGNRYALEKMYEEHNFKNKPFYTAQFSIGDFDNVLALVGYSKLDQCMSDVADAIRAEFDDSGFLYTKTGEELMFVFNENANSVEVSNKAEHIRKLIQDILAKEINISCPIVGAVAYSENFRTRSFDSFLTSLHIATQRSTGTAPFAFI